MPPLSSEHASWFAEQVQPHGAALRAYLLAEFPSLHDADDLVQESFLRVIRVHQDGDNVKSPKGLLFAIARNLARDLVRRQQVVSFEPITEVHGSSVFMDGTNVAEAVSHQQELELLSNAIQSLPKRCRQVFTLRTAYGLSQREIAARLGISENTVEKQIASGVRRCTEYFAQRGLP